MKPHDMEWQRLIDAARRAPDQADPKAPYGFATRVAAHAASLRPAGATWLYERMSLRALGVAALVAVVAVATNISPIQQMIEEDATALQQEAVVEMADVS